MRQEAVDVHPPNILNCGMGCCKGESDSLRKVLSGR